MVDAWLESVDRFDSHMTRATDAMHNRLCAIMACILADAHDLTHSQIVQKVQVNYFNGLFLLLYFDSPQE